MSTTPAAPANRWSVLALVAIVQFMIILDATIVNVALPAIQVDLGFAASDLQWVVTAYGLAFGGLLLLGGRAGDLFGRRRLFVAGVIVFTVASLLNGLATSPAMLIAARIAQGVGAALASPAALSIINTTFRDEGERTKALAVWGGVAAGAGAIGLLLGGALTEWLSWEWIFYINIPIGTVAALLALRTIPESRLTERTGFDLAGAFTVTAGLALLTYAISQAESAGWTDGRTLGLAAGAVALLVLFAVIESRLREPLLRLALLRIRSLTTANLAMFLAAGGMFATFFIGTLYLQQVRGYDPIETGLAFLPLALGSVVGSGLGQLAVRRVGVKPVLLAGFGLTALGLGWFSQIGVDTSYAGLMLPAFVVAAVGIGLSFIGLTLVATTNIADGDAGLASGLFNTSQQIGASIGIAVLATIAGDVTSSRLADVADEPGAAAIAQATVDGFGTAMLVGAALALLGLFVVALGLRSQEVAHIRGDEAVAAAV